MELQTFEDFKKKYQLVKNNLIERSEYQGYIFKDILEERLRITLHTNPLCIWSIKDNVISNHYVGDADGYFIATIPETEKVEFTI